MPRTVSFSDPIFPGCKLVDVDLTLSNAEGGSYDETFVDNRIVTGMRVVGIECDELENFDADIKFTPSFGRIRIQCADFQGTNVTVKLFLLKILDDPTAVTSTEYDILNNKIELIENVESNYAITIATSDWELSNGEYIYEYENEAITTSNSVEVEFLEGNTDPDVDVIETEKTNGMVTFYSPYVPSAAVSVNIKVTNARPKDIEEITGDMVATDVVDGASNVDEALGALNSKIVTTDISSDVTFRTGINTNISKVTRCGNIVDVSIQGVMTLTLGDNIVTGLPVAISSILNFIALTGKNLTTARATLINGDLVAQAASSGDYLLHFSYICANS